MLQTIFNFRGTDYKVNCIPESYDNLEQAANMTRNSHLSRTGEKKSHCCSVQFVFKGAYDPHGIRFKLTSKYRKTQPHASSVKRVRNFMLCWKSGLLVCLRKNSRLWRQQTMFSMRCRGGGTYGSCTARWVLLLAVVNKYDTEDDVLVGRVSRC